MYTAEASNTHGQASSQASIIVKSKTFSSVFWNLSIAKQNTFAGEPNLDYESFLYKVTTYFIFVSTS